MQTLKRCPFCGDEMETFHGVLRHKEQGDCVIGQYAWDDTNNARWNRRAVDLLLHNSNPVASHDPVTPADKAPADLVPVATVGGLSRYHLDKWTDDDFKAHIPAVRQALSEALTLYGPEAAERIAALEAENEHLRLAAQSDGWLYFNEDAGTEWAEQHPIESGEVPDAKDIRPATSIALHGELIPAWEDLAKQKRRAETAEAREAQLETENARLNHAIEIAKDALATYGDRDGYADEEGEIPEPDEGVLARSTLVAIRAALAQRESKP